MAVESQSFLVQVLDFFKPRRQKHIDRSSLFDLPKKRFRWRVHDLITAPPYSRSNIGRISLKAGLKLGGAPTVRGSACTGFQVPDDGCQSSYGGDQLP